MSEVRTLEELLGRVEAASGADRELEVALYRAFTPADDFTIRILDGSFHDVHDVQIGVGGASYRTGQGGSGGAFPIPHYSKSIDAAVALVEKKLPGCWVDLCGPRKYLHIPTPSPNYWRGMVNAWNAQGDVIGWGATPALALIAALLRALIAQKAIPSPAMSEGTGSIRATDET